MSAQQAGQLLLLEAESLYCPDAGGVIDGGVTVAIRDGRILWRGRREALPAELHRNQEAATTVEFGSSTMLAPGLVDLHCHCDPTGGEISRYGVDPDEVYLPRGVTTILSQGDAGADTWEAYARTTGGCRTRCLMAMNLLRAGEVPSYFEGRKGGEDLVDFDVAACVAAMRAGGQAVWGVDINTGHNHGPTHELREAAARAVAAAEATGTNILFGMRRPTDGWSFAQQLSMLREGDVVTCECEIPCTPCNPTQSTNPLWCRGKPGADIYRGPPIGPHDITASDGVMLESGGPVHPAFFEARQRGVIFDVGYGGTAFNFAVAEAAISQGFLPDTISSDMHSQVDHARLQPSGTTGHARHDLLRTMAKLEAAGMPRLDVLRAVTATPAKVLGLAGEIGTLLPGACADVVALDLRHDPNGCALQDRAEPPNRRWVSGYYEPVCVVRAGEIVKGGGDSSGCVTEASAAKL